MDARLRPFSLSFPSLPHPRLSASCRFQTPGAGSGGSSTAGTASRAAALQLQLLLSAAAKQPRLAAVLASTGLLEEAVVGILQAHGEGRLQAAELMSAKFSLGSGARVAEEWGVGALPAHLPPGWHAGCQAWLQIGVLRPWALVPACRWQRTAKAP